MHINADLYESRQDLEQLADELCEMKQNVNTQKALTLDYAINLIDEIIDAAETEG